MVRGELLQDVEQVLCFEKAVLAHALQGKGECLVQERVTQAGLGPADTRDGSRDEDKARHFIPPGAPVFWFGAFLSG